MYVVDYEALTPRRPARRCKLLIFSVLCRSTILMQKKCGAQHSPRPAPTTTPLTIILLRADGRGSEYNPTPLHDAACDHHDRSGDCKNPQLAAGA